MIGVVEIVLAVVEAVAAPVVDSVVPLVVVVEMVALVVEVLSGNAEVVIPNIEVVSLVVSPPVVVVEDVALVGQGKNSQRLLGSQPTEVPLPSKHSCVSVVHTIGPSVVLEVAIVVLEPSVLVVVLVVDEVGQEKSQLFVGSRPTNVPSGHCVTSAGQKIGPVMLGPSALVVVLVVDDSP